MKDGDLATYYCLQMIFRMGWPLAIASTGKGFDTKERRCVDLLPK